MITQINGVSQAPQKLDGDGHDMWLEQVTIAGRINQRYGNHGVDQENQADDQLNGRTTWRNELEIYGPEQRRTGTTGRNTFSVKSGNKSAGMKSEIKYRR